MHGAFKVTGRLSMLRAGVEVGAWVWDTPTDISQGRLKPSSLPPTIEAFAAYGEVSIVSELTKAIALMNKKQG